MLVGVAGGMGRPGHWSNPAPVTAMAPAGSPAAASGDSHVVRHGRPRHVWVTDPQDPAYQAPGLLIEWRNLPGRGWEARTICAHERDGDVTVREEWLPAERITPA